MYELLHSNIHVDSFSYDFRLLDAADENDDVRVALQVGCFADFNSFERSGAEDHECAAMTNTDTDVTVSQEHDIVFPCHLISSSPIKVENLFHELVKGAVDETQTPMKERLLMLTVIRRMLMATLVQENPGWRAATIRAKTKLNVDLCFDWRSSTDGCCQHYQDMAFDGESGEAKTCAVCLNDISMDDDDVLEKLCCGHCFHGGCIRTWIQEMKYSCPLCRATFFTFPDFYS